MPDAAVDPAPSPIHPDPATPTRTRRWPWVALLALLLFLPFAWTWVPWPQRQTGYAWMLLLIFVPVLVHPVVTRYAGPVPRFFWWGLGGIAVVGALVIAAMFLWLFGPFFDFAWGPAPEVIER